MNDASIVPAVVRQAPQPSAKTLLTLARRRVYERLERAADFPILVLHAPAGFGKSTVVQEFFFDRGRRHRMLQVTTTNGDLLGFMRTFANTLGDLVPALRTSFMGVYDRIHRVDEAAREIATWAADNLAHVEQTIVLDGLEHVTDDRLLPLLCELIDQTAHTPIRWVLVAQTADRFPIAKWLANDRMDLPIDDVDLALTYEDLLGAIERSGAAIPRSTVREMCGAAGNWPAAVALALGDGAAWPRIVSDPPEVRPYAFFARRAFAARSENERRFLLETCLYRYFDRQLLSRAGWTSIEPMLERLLDIGAIIDAEIDGRFRYHEIFRAFLEERLRASPDGLYTRIATQSADVCQSVARWSDAIELFTDVQATMPLARLLGEHGFELVDRGEADIVYRALDKLSDLEFAAFPVALAVKAGLESLHGSLDVAEAWFRHALKNAGDTSQRGAIVFRFATDLVRQDRRDAIDLLEPIVAEGGQSLALSISLAGLLATAYATHQQNTQAALTIEEALTRLTDVDDPAIRAKLYFQAGYVAFFARDPVRARTFAQQAVETARSSQLYDIAARALSILYNVAMDYDDDVRAGRRYLDELASCSVKAGSRHLLIYATLCQFEIEVFCGNVEGSARLDEALRALEVDYSLFASETLLPAQALRATWSGDFHRAYRLIAPTAEKQITPMRRSQRYAEIALYAAAGGLRAEGSAAVRKALAIAAHGDPADRAVSFSMAYAALALTLLGRHRRAAHLLTSLQRSNVVTTRIASFITAIQAINDRWELGRYPGDVHDVLEELSRCDLGGIGRLIEALPLPETLRGQFAQLNTSEREALIHMSAGLNSAEVAALSGHPIEAVDALVVSLCRKLGCTSTRHAIALAKSVDGLRAIAVVQ